MEGVRCVASQGLLESPLNLAQTAGTSHELAFPQALVFPSN